MATTPICRCRVLYLGSSVPHITKDGLQGIQEPLRDLYPEQGSFSAKGIDSWLSVWSNGLLLENVDESMRQVTRFFNIETLHYCAAVRYVVVPGTNGERVEKFLPLDSPFARHADPNHAPLFACILRRTAGIKVLECHAFICKKEAAANALVRCCFHSYADSMQAKHLEENSYYLENKRSRSMSGLNTLEKVEVWRSNADATNGSAVLPPKVENGDQQDSSNNEQDDDNYKVWTGIAPTERELLYVDASGTMKSLKSGSATTRSAQMKVRQMVGPPPRPPPPPSPSLLLNGHKEHKIKNQGMKPSKARNKKPKHHKEGPPLPVNGAMNGFRPTSAMDPYAVHQPQSIYGGGFYTERRVRRMGRPPIPGHEEPIYIPSTRPLSPMSSYQPAAFPYEQYFMQYGTAPRGNRIFKGDAKKRHLHPAMPPLPPPPHDYQPIYIAQPPSSHYQIPSIPAERKPVATYHGPKDIVNGDYHNARDPRDDHLYNASVHKRKGRAKESINGDDHIARDPRDDSPFNTGIYKRKGRGKESVNGDDHIARDPRDDSPFNTGIYKRKGRGKESVNGDDHIARDPRDDSPYNTGIYKRKGRGKESVNGEENGDDSKDDSPFNTGIYKKKGHLNERAFSYSIRQEHRSRSNSLANLQFFAEGEQPNGAPRGSSSPAPGGHHHQRSRDEDRKERELAQLVSALDLKENGFNSRLDDSNNRDVLMDTNFMRRKTPAY